VIIFFPGLMRHCCISKGMPFGYHKRHRNSQLFRTTRECTRRLRHWMRIYQHGKFEVGTWVFKLCFYLPNM